MRRENHLPIPGISPQSSDPSDRLIVALDVGSAAEAVALAQQLHGRCRWVKVGMELFYAAGRDLIPALQALHLAVFLDLKIHDIPNTAASAVRSVSSLNVQLLTLHAAGGPAMLAAAHAETASQPGSPLLTAVTVLTSMDETEMHTVGMEGTPRDQVLRLASLSLASGLTALVASPHEVPALRGRFGASPTLIVPGIRPAAAASDDQRRIATPRQAIRDGASLLVVGRPITRAAHPLRALEGVLREIAEGIADA